MTTTKTRKATTKAPLTLHAPANTIRPDRLYQFNDGGRKNAGFKGTTGDCGVRAIAIATDADYRTVYESVRRHLKQKYTSGPNASPRNGIFVTDYKDYMDSIGWVWVPLMRPGQGCKFHLAWDELPSGRIITRLSRHYCAVINGTVHDNHYPNEGSATGRCVYGYWHSRT